MIILRYLEIFFRLTAPRCPSMADGTVSLRKSHDIVILSFCNIVKGQAKFLYMYISKQTIPKSPKVSNQTQQGFFKAAVQSLCTLFLFFLFLYVWLSNWSLKWFQPQNVITLWLCPSLNPYFSSYSRQLQNRHKRLRKWKKMLWIPDFHLRKKRPHHHQHWTWSSALYDQHYQK